MSRAELTKQIDAAMPEIRRLYLLRHLGTSEIAKRLGLNVKTVAIRLSREGFLKSKKDANKNRRKVPDTDVINLYKEGVTVQGIVDKLGVDYQSVYQVLHRNSIDPNRLSLEAKAKCSRRLTTDQEDTICSLYNQGYYGNEIARKLGIGHQTVLRVLKKNGIQVIRRVPIHTARFLYSGLKGTVSMRSSWEAEIAEVFDYFKIEWQYEPRAFDLSTKHQYTPDFYLPEYDAFVEVKGVWTKEALRKFNLFIAEYPDVTIFVCRHPGWFGQLFLLRKLFEKKLGHNVAKMPEEERLEYIREQALMLYAEIAEVLQEVPWKKHKVYSNQADREKYLSELVDVLIFLLNLMAAYNADEQDIISKARTVEMKNFIRQRVGYRGPVGEDLTGSDLWKNYVQ